MALEQLPKLTSQSSLVERVKYQISVGSPLVFVTGSRESGKTVFCEQLISSLDGNEYQCAFVPCQDRLPIQKLREVLLQQLSDNMVFNSEDHLLGTIQRISFNANKVLIVVDDIDRASPEFFNDLLAVYQTYLKQNLISLVVTSAQVWADSEAHRLRNESVQPLEMEIQPLSNPEALTLISFYRRFYGQPVLNDRDLQMMYNIKACDGNPGAIRKLVEKLSKGSSDDTTANGSAPTASAPSSDKKKYAIIGGIVAVVAIAALCSIFVLNKDKDSSKEITKVTTEPVIATEPVRLEPELSKTRTDLNPVVSDNKGNNEGITPVVIQEGPEEQIQELSENASVVVTDESNASSNDNATNPVVITEDTKSEEAKDVLAPNDEKVANKTEITEVNVKKTEDKPIKTEKAETETKVAKVEQRNTNTSKDTTLNVATNKNKDSQNVNKNSEKPVEPKQTTKPVVVAKNEENKATTKTTPVSSVDSKKDTKQDKVSTETKIASNEVANKTEEPIVLNNQKKVENPKPPKPAKVPSGGSGDFYVISGSHYTVQLAAGSKAGVESLRRKAKGGWVLSRPSRGDYILVYGDFKSRKEAQNGISLLPAELRNSKPWPKSIGQVQKETK